MRENIKKITILISIGIIFLLLNVKTYAVNLNNEDRFLNIDLKVNLKNNPDVYLKKVENLSSRLYTLADSNGVHYFCLNEAKYYPNGNVSYIINNEDPLPSNIYWLISNFHNDGPVVEFNNSNFFTKYAATQIAIWSLTNPSNTLSEIVNSNPIIKDILLYASDYTGDTSDYQKIENDINKINLNLEPIISLGEQNNAFQFSSKISIQNMTEDFSIVDNSEKFEISIMYANEKESIEITDSTSIDYNNNTQILNFSIPSSIINQHSYDKALIVNVKLSVESKKIFYFQCNPINSAYQPLGNGQKIYVNLSDTNSLEIMDTTNIIIQKKWTDGNNQDGIRVNQIFVKLLADGILYKDSILLSEINDWNVTIPNVPKYNEKGEEIVYTVKEVGIPSGYEVTTNDQDKGNIILTNNHTPEKTQINGMKTWNDGNNQDGKRPDTIIVNLLANGELIYSKEVSEKENWSYSFTDLDKFKDGEEITYTITENSVPEYIPEFSGTNITNSYIPGKTSVTVTKAWEDNNNQDNLRPTTITVQLYGNGKEVGNQVVLNEGNNWSTIWNDLPEKESGKEIVYTVKEVDIPSGYEVTTNDQDKGNIILTNNHTPEKTQINGMKTWNDGNNQDGKRPDTIIVNLLANGELIYSKEVSEKENWSYSFTDLDKFKDGEEITYTITENSVPEYIPEFSGTNITNSYIPGKTSVTVTKAWEDNNNQDNLRPTTITVQLYGNGKEVGNQVVLNEGNNWSTIWNDLPEKESGKEIVYTVKEVDIPSGYEVTTNDQDKGNIILTNNHTPEKTQINGMKTWNDGNNQDGKRPDTIIVNLLANGELIYSKEVSEKENWSYSFTDLDKFKDGEEITYTITENSVPEYIPEFSGTNITNSYIPGKTSVTVTKAWEDNNNQDNLRPTTITVQLYGNGKEVGNQVVLNEGNNWSTIWNDLPEKESGKEIVYTVKEVDIPSGYEVTTNDQDKGNIILTNNHTPEKTQINGMKTWNDGNNQDGKRPDTIIVNLLANGELIYSKEVSEKENWSYSFTDLDKFKDGEEITYTITENSVPEYTPEFSGTNITNSYTPGKTSVTVTKAWEDNNNQDNLRPTTITVQLYGNGKEVGNQVVLNEGNNWSTIWNDLPEKESGKEIVYTVKEVDIPSGYEVTTNDQDKANIILTNNHTPKKSPHPSSFYPITGEIKNNLYIMFSILIIIIVSFIVVKKYTKK